MAESIAVHFSEVSWVALRNFLDEISCKVEADEFNFHCWNYPDGENPLVYVYEGDLILNDYDDKDLDQLFCYLEDFPKSSLIIRLRGSLGNESVNGAVQLSVALLRQFAGVVDDTFTESEIWTLEEIENNVKKGSGAFLGVYREPE